MSKKELEKMNKLSKRCAYFLNWASKKNIEDKEFELCDDKIARFNKYLKENNLNEAGEPIKLTPNN